MRRHEGKRITLSKQQLKEWALRHGYSEDKYGNMVKTMPSAISGHEPKEYRLKFQDTSLRREVKVKHSATKYSPASSEWVRLTSGYYKDLSIDKKDKLAGMKW